MSNRLNWILIALGAVLLGGCAAMSAEECRTVDWYEQGMRDALNGYGRSRIGVLREACAEAGVTPDVTRYEQGWAHGIQQFCTPANGARWGRQGHDYNNTCPPELEAEFLGPYQAGRRVADARSRIESLRNQQRNAERRLDKSEDEDRRRRLRRELRDLDWQLDRARDELDRAEFDFRRWAY